MATRSSRRRRKHAAAKQKRTARAESSRPLPLLSNGLAQVASRPVPMRHVDTMCTPCSSLSPTAVPIEVTLPSASEQHSGGRTGSSLQTLRQRRTASLGEFLWLAVIVVLFFAVLLWAAPMAWGGEWRKFDGPVTFEGTITGTCKLVTHVIEAGENPVEMHGTDIIYVDTKGGQKPYPRVSLLELHAKSQAKIRELEVRVEAMEGHGRVGYCFLLIIGCFAADAFGRSRANEKRIERVIRPKGGGKSATASRGAM